MLYRNFPLSYGLIYWLLILGSTILVFSSENLFSCQWVQHYTLLSLLFDSVYLILYGDFVEFGLNFVQEDKYESVCFILHAIIQVNQHHFLKILSFTQCVFLSYQIFGLHGCVVSIILHSVSVFVTIPCCFYCYSFIV